jgi:hypothetical protein
MVKLCNSCGKEFDERIKGVRYSSSVKGVLFFCSDECCKNYLNESSKLVKEIRVHRFLLGLAGGYSLDEINHLFRVDKMTLI